MSTIDISQLQQGPQVWLPRVQAGETLTVVNEDRAVAEIHPVTTPQPAISRPAGLAHGEFVVPDDFDAPLPDFVLREFEGA